MTDFTLTPIPGLGRSMGVKLIVVCGLALLMCIPALFVESQVTDRTSRQAAVAKEISGYMGGEQTLLGPTLAIPYSIAAQSADEAARQGMYLVFPVHAAATAQTTTEERHRSLFRVPVFQANVKMESSFDLSGVPAAAPSGMVLDWNRAELVVGVSNPRAAQTDALLTVDGKTTTLVPAAIAQSMTVGNNQNSQWLLSLLGANASELAKPGAHFTAISTLRLSGTERVAMLAYGKSTQLRMQGDWPNPGFDGGFLPVSRQLSDHGFRAEWSIPFIARAVRAEGTADSITSLDATAMGVSFVEVADPYQSVDRSLKYVLLFLGLIFLAYFVFEVTTGKRVHPAQYLLVGLAQIIFYLLLLSLAERAGFDWAFLLAGAATVVLLAANAGWVFARREHGWRAFVIFTVLYGLIYLLLRLEDNALLVGSLASFLAVAAGMYFTRKLDWYSSLPVMDRPEPPVVG
jgi:inner membrane protein